jgi:hypothetical protein
MASGNNVEDDQVEERQTGDNGRKREEQEELEWKIRRTLIRDVTADLLAYILPAETSEEVQFMKHLSIMIKDITLEEMSERTMQTKIPALFEV